MTDSTFTFRVEESLKEAFTAAARASDRSAAQILRAAMRAFLAEQEIAKLPRPPMTSWIESKIARARTAIAEGRAYGEDEMAARFARFRAAARAAAS